jgi:deferrochelatase/peroxidase EfeB
MSTPAPPSTPDWSNVQGLVRSGYTHPFSTHLLFTFPTPLAAAARQSFFAALLPALQSSADWGNKKPASMLNVGLTAGALAKMGQPTAAAQSAFPADFRTPNYTGNNLPDQWLSMDGTALFAASAVDCVVHVYGLTQGDLEALVAVVTGAAGAAGITERLPLAQGDGRLTQCNLPSGEVHFGFMDGISEPDLRTPSTGGVLPGDLANFVIGYADPSLPPDQVNVDPATGPAGDFARDGIYDGFAVIFQDSSEFSAYLAQQGAALAERLGRTPDEAGEWVAAKIMGRWRNGSPLELSPDWPERSTSRSSDFGYADDTTGVRCPFSAHVRVSNPRDQVLKPIAQHPFPRLLRRGVPYGPPPVRGVTDNEDRGLVGLFLCGSLSQQFGKVLAWQQVNNFSSVFQPVSFATQDALMGNREATNVTLPVPMAEGDPVTLPALPEWIKYRGVAFCLLPSISTLTALAQAEPVFGGGGA